MSETNTDAAVLEAEALEDADFASGFASTATAKEAEKPAATPAVPVPVTPIVETPAAPAVVEPSVAPAEDEPKYVQVTEKDWAEFRAVAAKTASYDGQLSKAFGIIGNMQKIVTGLQASTQAGRKVEIPADAFAGMEQDFPELAEQTRTALEKALSGMVGTGAPEFDEAKLRAMLATANAEREIEALADEYPDWRDVVGATAPGGTPPADNPFRLWLATKDDAYQARVNNSTSSAVIARAIRSFEASTKAREAPPPPKPVVPPVATPPAVRPAPNPRDVERADRLREAIQPRGDGNGTPPGKSEDDEFLAGFNSR